MASSPRPAEQQIRSLEVTLVKESDPAGSSNHTPTPDDPDDLAERRYRRLVDNSPDPMCVHADGVVVYVNPAGVRGFGAQTAEQLVGQMITDHVHPDSIAPMLDRIVALRHDGDTSSPSEAVLRRLDGSSIDVEAVSVLTTWNGKPAYQVVFRDLTAQKAAQATLRYQAALVDHVSDAIIATTTSGTVSSWNAAAEAIYRRPAAEALGLTVSEAFDANVELAEIIAGGGISYATHRDADGSPLRIRVSVTAIDDGYVLLCSDHTALRRAENRFESVVKSLPDGVAVLDKDAQPVAMNPAVGRILQLRSSNVEPYYRDRAASFPMYDADGIAISEDERPVRKTVATRTPMENQVYGVDRADGSRVWLSMSCCLLDPADPDQSDVLLSFSDVTAEHNARARLTHQAHHDPLTGLPNRAQVETRVAAATPTPAAVLFIDLDDLKRVNDELGHHAGDTVIKVAAQRLRSALRAEDFIGRLGGDEFVALIHGAVDRATLEALTARMHTELAAPVTIAGVHRTITASIGVLQLIDGAQPEVQQILRSADAAMYAAKAARKGTHYAQGDVET